MNTKINSLLALLASAVAAISSPVALSQTSGTVTPPSGTAAPATHGPYSTDTPVGTLLDDPKAYAVLAQVFPDVLKANDNPMGRTMSLRQMQPYSPDLTDAKLAEIDAALAKLNN